MTYQRLQGSKDYSMGIIDTSMLNKIFGQAIALIDTKVTVTS